MRFHKLDLNQLVVLDALLSECSIKRAAERLFLSSAATSCALTRLRKYFDDDLLMRVGKVMLLTPKAEDLKKPIRDVLLQIQGVMTTNSTVFDPAKSTRKISIEATDYVVHVLLSRVLNRAWHEAPNMQFAVRTANVHTAAHFNAGEVDILIRPDFHILREHPSERLFQDSWSCVVCANNKQIGKTLPLKKYLASGHVVMEWGIHGVTTSDSAEAAKLGYARRADITAETFAVVPLLLAGTNRIATLQNRIIQLFLGNTPPLRVLACPFPIPKLVEVVQWQKHQERDPAIAWFRSLLKREAAMLEDPLGIR